MKIALLSPPMGCITHSGAALPYLTAALRAEGHEVTQHDLGIAVVDRLLSRENLAAAAELIGPRLERISKLERPSKKDRDHRDLLTLARACAPVVIETIADAKNALRDPQRFYRPDEYTRAANAVRRACDLISAAHFPTRLSPTSCRFPGVISLANIYKLGPDPAINPFYHPMRMRIEEMFAAGDFPLAGISLTYEQQIVPAFLAARLIKEFSPHTHVVIGGATATLAEPRLRGVKAAFRHADSYVFGEGEGALVALAESIAAGDGPPAGLRNLHHPGDGSRGLECGYEYERGDFNSIPTPDYAGLNLSDYLSPQPVFLLANSRGCYWRKCAFCNVAPAFSHSFQQRSLELLRRDVQTLATASRARHFFFADEAISPARCGQIASVMSSIAPDLNWQTYVRYEKGFDAARLAHMAQSGCRLLSFGNESGCQRVLDLMRKGTNARQSRKIIQSAHEAGIAVGLQSFLGFPTETFAEAMQTIDAIAAMKEWVTTSGLNLFALMERSPVAACPDEFSVSDITTIAPAALLPQYTYKTSHGMTRQEAEEALKIANRKTYDAFPAQFIFLDGGFGGNLLLYLSRHRQTNLEKLFFRLPDKTTLLASKLRLKPSVEIIRLSGKSAVLFSRDDLRVAAMDRETLELVGLHDGTRTVSDLARGFVRSAIRPGPDHNQLPAFLAATFALIRENMLEVPPGG